MGESERQRLLLIYYFYSIMLEGRERLMCLIDRCMKRMLQKANIVMLMAVLICTSSVFLLSISESFTLMEIIFEVCSAFGTTGLSMGITPDLSIFGKLLIITLMFIGRVGILTFIILISTKGNQENYRFPKERVIIG